MIKNNDVITIDQICRTCQKDCKFKIPNQFCEKCFIKNQLKSPKIQKKLFLRGLQKASLYLTLWLGFLLILHYFYSGFDLKTAILSFVLGIIITPLVNIITHVQIL